MVDACAAQIKILEASNHPVKFRNTKKRQLLMKKKLHVFEKAPIIDRITLFLGSRASLSKPLVTSLASNDGGTNIIHVAKPSNPDSFDTHPSLEQDRNQRIRPNLPTTGTRTTDSYSCRNRNLRMGDSESRKPVFPLAIDLTRMPNTAPFSLLSKAARIQVHRKLFQK